MRLLAVDIINTAVGFCYADMATGDQNRLTFVSRTTDVIKTHSGDATKNPPS